MENAKRTFLVSLAVLVISLASAGEHIRNAMKVRAVQAEELAENSDETLPVAPTISLDIFNAVFHVAQLVFHSDLIFEFSLPDIKETKAHSVFETALNFTKYNRTLFQQIISPNGP